MRRPRRARQGDHARRERRRALPQRTARAPTSARLRSSRARHHRHRRRGQELADRRTAAPPPARLPADAHRDPVRRPDAQAHRWRAARRPHPHERDPERSLLPALDGDAPRERRVVGLGAGRPRRAALRRLRPDPVGELRHRPVGHRDHRARGSLALRDDARVRRVEPAREDRHARLRGPRRDQQV